MRGWGVATPCLLALLMVSVTAQPLVVPHRLSLEESENMATFSIDAWDIANFSDVAVPQGFDQTSYMDYSDVGVLINNKSEASRTIGWAFVQARSIPLQHVLLWDEDGTPTGETINRNQFNDYFSDPFREWISNNSLESELNYLVTTKGVPLRVSGGNNKVSFDNEIALVGGSYDSFIGQDYWTIAEYGPFANNGAGKMEVFSRQKHGFFLVTRLTGYTVDTALGLIELANQSLGNRGQFVLDLATNRNNSGYKYWNDDLYTANTTLNGTMGLPVTFNQNSTFLTDQSEVIGYASWGSNDGSWGENWLPNAGFDTDDASYTSGAKYWNATIPNLTAGDTFNWSYQTEHKRNGNGAVEASLSAVCNDASGDGTQGILAEYFDNDGISFNTASMPLLIDRVPDHVRLESDLQYSSSSQAYSGLDDRFKNDWGGRFSGLIDIPDAGNWTFFITSDDGSELWVDGQSLVTNYGSHGMSEQSNYLQLSEGLHDFKIEFFQGGGPHGLQLSWQGPNQSKALIPPSAFQVAGDYIPAENNLVHHWDFEDGSGDYALNSVNNSANFTLNNMNSSNWRTCADGYCLWYDGVDDYVEIDVDNWLGNFTVSQWVWANSTTLPNYSTTFAVDDDSGSNASFQHAVISGEWRLHNNQTHTFGDVQAQRWTHLVTVYDNGTVRQYLDGVLVQNTTFPIGAVNNIELYKMGVNRAGNTHFEGMIDNVMIWDIALDDQDITVLHRDIYEDCATYSGNGNSAELEQTYVIPNEVKNHTWLLSVYGTRKGDVYGDFTLVVESLDDNGTLLSTNTSSSKTFGPSWESAKIRFRPDANATKFRIRIPLDIVGTSTDGSVYLDTLNLQPIRPHNDWIPGSIVETAVSTGGRSFTTGTSYGQSLVADILEDGASATKGYVYEPYLTAVCYPSILLANYAQGFTMAEAYYAANPMVSWMGVVVGDPKMAAFADRLHDVNISAMQVNQTLTVGNNGTIRLIIENLGMGQANGTIEIRERSGNILLATYNLSLAPGDMSGSRIIFDAEVAATKSGYVEFVARWHNASQEYPERITANNENSLNLLINDIPTVDDAWCASSQVERGDGFTCTAVASDEVSVAWLQMAWRLNNQSQNLTTQWHWYPAVQFVNDNWWASMEMPRNVSLGSLDLAVEAFDNRNASSGVRIYSNLSQVINAIPKWYGIHVQSIDSEMWLGDSNLPPNPEQGLLRQEQVRLQGCVEDADHNIATEQPNFAASRGVVGAVLFSGEIAPGLYCYNSTWIIAIGGDVAPVILQLWVDGQLFSQRQIKIADRKPVVELELRDADGAKINSSTGANEHLWVGYSDVDDPGTSAYGDLVIEWPDRLPITIPVNIPGDSNGVSIEIPPAPAGLSRGLVIITANILGAHSNAVEVAEQWEISVTTPRILSIEICNASGELEELRPNSQAAIYLHLRSSRPLESIQVILAQGEWSVDATVLDLSSTPWNNSSPIGCEANSSIANNRTEVATYKVTADSKFIGGGAEIIAQIIDIDGLSSNFHLQTSIAHRAPEVTLMGELEYEIGENVELSAIIYDPDGLSGIKCSFIFSNHRGVSILTIMGTPDSSGEIRIEQNAAKFPVDENISVNVTCVDALGLSAEAELSGTIIVRVPQLSEQVASNVSSTGEGGASSPMLVGIILMLALIATLVIRAKVNQRNRGRLERDDDEQSKAWEDMAMLKSTENGDSSEQPLQQGHHDEAEPLGQPAQEGPLGHDDSSLGSEVMSDQPPQSVVELQHADQQQKTGENLEAEASFKQDMAASEAEHSHSVDEIMDELND
ncbi:MAG TPA: hypothetical protein EYN88_05080 [Candidatus Poseidoniales archaeon]|nr:hypothetical protein [Candidatus Poseidoniales archaeon]